MDTNFKKLYKICETQAGYFTTGQAHHAGYSRQSVAAHASSDLFTHIAQGIYRFTYYPSSPYEDLMIAVLKSGPQAVLSHHSAFAVYKLSDLMPAQIHITIPKNRSRRRTGVRYHTSKISKKETTNFEGLPITTVERTITDGIRSGLEAGLMQQAVDQALQRGMVTTHSLIEQANRYGEKTQETMKQYLGG